MKTRIFLSKTALKSVDCKSFTKEFLTCLQSFLPLQPSRKRMTWKFTCVRKTYYTISRKKLTSVDAALTAETKNNEITENFSIELESNFDKLSFVFATSFSFRLNFNYVLISLWNKFYIVSVQKLNEKQILKRHLIRLFSLHLIVTQSISISNFHSNVFIYMNINFSA